MATSALVIGLGTSGLHIIEECQQFHYQFTGTNKPDKVEYLYLETDKNATPKATAMGTNDIERVYITLEQIAANTVALQRDNSSDKSWIPPVESALAGGDGAGGQSSYGRLALWFHYKEVRDKIESKWARIGGDDSTYVFIVGTLTGGTCSGTCIDMAYLVRDITKSDKVFGLFLAPSERQWGIGGSDALFYNFYSTIAALHYYSDENVVFKCRYPNGREINNPAAPFNVCYFLSLDYTSGFAPINSVADLYKVAGLHVFARIHSMGMVDNAGEAMPTFSTTLDRRYVDVRTTVPNYRFSTFGSKLIFYPKELLKELFGVSLATAELERWVNSQVYIDARGNKVQIAGQRNNIANGVKKEFESLVVSSLNSIDSLPYNGGTLESSFANEANVLLAKEYSEPSPRAFMFNLLSADNASNYMTMVSNNDKAIRDSLVDAIYATIVKKIDDYKNLFVGTLILETIAKTMDDMLAFWKKEYRITGDDAQWNQFIQRQIANMLDNDKLPKVLLQNKAYYTEQFANLLMLAKMHVACKVLTLLSSEIRTKQTPSIKGSDNVKLLPSVPMMQDIVAKVQGVISNEDGTSNVTLTRRSSEIRSTLSTDVRNFAAIFANGSLEQDLKGLETEYVNNVKTRSPFGSGVVTAGVPLWEYLGKVNKDSLYRDSVVHSIRYVKDNLQGLQDTTINGIIQNISATPNDPQWLSIREFIAGDKNEICRHMPGQIKLNNALYRFDEHRCLTLIYNNGDLRTLQQQMPLNSVDPVNDRGCELNGLNDAIIAYQEYGFMGNNNMPFDPTVHIDINATIKERIKDNVDYESETAQIPSTFVFKRRVPYLTKEQFQNILNA